MRPLRPAITFIAICLSISAFAAPPSGFRQGPSFRLRTPEELRATLAGSEAAKAAIDSGAEALSLAAGDFNVDGLPDLAVGYATATGGAIALHRGNLDAFAPQTDAEMLELQQGGRRPPFASESRVFDVPFRPDFLAMANVIGDDHVDLIGASRNGDSLYVFPGNGTGRFGEPVEVKVSGGITSLTAGAFGGVHEYRAVLAGVGGSVEVLRGGARELTTVTTVPLGGTVSSIALGDVDGDFQDDAAIVAGGSVFILHGSDARVEAVALPKPVVALTLGGFIFDRNPGLEMAVLTADGDLQFLARSNIDSRLYTPAEARILRAAAREGKRLRLAALSTGAAGGWKVAETLSSVARFGRGAVPVVLRTRLTGRPQEDVTIFNSAAGQMATISRPLGQQGSASIPPAEVTVRPYGGRAVQAVSQRVNVDALPGIVLLDSGKGRPQIIAPLAGTITVNDTTDTIHSPGCATTGSGTCSLRDAILFNNNVSANTTISVPNGTYTLSIARSGVYDATAGALYVNQNVSIVGGGQASTVIQAGTTNANGVDMVMAVNEDISPLTDASASLSNLTLKFGHNNGTHGNDGDGGCMEFDTGTSGNATLTLSNVTLSDCSTTQGNGGGIAMFAFLAPGTGNVSMSGCIIQNNSAKDGSGGSPVADAGGIWISAGTKLTMSSSQVLNNSAVQLDSGVASGFGGGIFSFNTTANNPLSQIHASTISGNKSSGDGGGIYAAQNMTVDQGTVISGNTAGTDGTNAVSGGDGGGLFVNVSTPDAVTLTKVSITGNTASGNGGAILAGNGGTGSLTMSLSRLAGNTATLGTNLRNNSFSVTATNNWWGTDNPSSTISLNGGTTTFDPFVVLTNNSSADRIGINQSTTLTGDLSRDNHGTSLSGSLDEVVGLPITFNGAVLGTIPQAQPETLGSPAPTATATFNAGGTSGRGSANATVDQAVVAANSNVIAGASESGTTATITTQGVHNHVVGDTVVISGVGVSGYNGTFVVTSVPNSTSFTYTTTGGLASSSGGTATAGIIVLEPPQITKSFGAATIPVNGTTTASFSINNPNVAQINAGFTDLLPTGLQVAATPGVTNTCGGSVTAVAGSGSISFSNTLLPIGVCTVSVNITGTADNNYTNSVQILSSDAGNGNLSSANLTVIDPPAIAKAFGAATIPLNGTTSLTFTLSNTNTNLTNTGVAFTDNLPAGLVVAATPNLSSTCSGTATATAGASSGSLSGASLAPGTSCTVSFDVQGTTAGVKNNSVQVTSTNAGTGNTSNTSITVVAPPSIAKAFGAAAIPLNGSTSLSFTVQNPNTTVALTGVAFSDTLPAGLVISTPNGLTGSCGAGTVTAIQATNVITLSGGTIAASSQCTFSVNVTGIAGGAQLNATGNVTSTEGGTGNAGSASLNVDAPPSIAKVFNPSTIALNATTSLTFTITNPAANVDALTGVAFTDTLPTGLTVANASATICGGTVTTTAPTGISLSGGSIAVSSQCQFSIVVTGASAGQYTNSTGNVTSTNGGTGNTASANLTVLGPPTITKVFGAASIPLNGTTSLTFNISNPNTTAGLTGVAFTDNLPAGLVVASTPNLNNTCGGTATAVGGAGSVSLSAGTLSASAGCTVSIDVQGTTAGVKNNSVQVTSTDGGTGNTSNASITVSAPPVIIKAFGAASIPVNGSTSLSFTIQNNNTTTTLTGVAFSDTLPAGLIVSTPNGLTGSCGAGTITATQATNVVSLSGGTIAASSSCTFSVNVTGTAAGLQNNTTGNVTSTEGGTGGTASASVKVEAPPSIAKVFTPSTIAPASTTSLTFTLTNPAANVDALSGVAFTDTLPTGLTVSNASATVCGGTLTTTAPTGISLSGATIAVNSQCQFSVTVTGTAAGQYTNTTGNVTSTNGGTGNTASANLTVGTPPSMSKVFGASSIRPHGSTSLSFTITNANPFTITGVQFSDTLPANLVVATPSGLTSSCGGTTTAAAGSGSVTLSGGSIGAGGSCTVTVNVTSALAGTYVNTTGPVSAATTGSGNTATATLAVSLPAGDFDGDGKSDIGWRDAATGDDAAWLMNGAQVGTPARLPRIADLNWKMAGSGDFDGDGKADLIWVNTSSGQVVIWLMNGPNIATGATATVLKSTDWHLGGVGDFNGDGKSDVIWRNVTTGEVVVWFMNGTQINSAANLTPVTDLNWNIVGVGDFNNDGMGDVLWRDGATGANVVWLMNGTTVTASMTDPVPDLNYVVAGVGDVNGDGRADVVWFNGTTGSVVLWQMNGAAVASATTVGAVASANWHLEAVGDFDADGKADLMFRNVATADVVEWLMSGPSTKQVTLITTVNNLTWAMMAPR